MHAKVHICLNELRFYLRHFIISYWNECYTRWYFQVINHIEFCSQSEQSDVLCGCGIALSHGLWKWLKCIWESRGLKDSRDSHINKTMDFLRALVAELINHSPELWNIWHIQDFVSAIFIVRRLRLKCRPGWILKGLHW